MPRLACRTRSFLHFLNRLNFFPSTDPNPPRQTQPEPEKPKSINHLPRPRTPYLIPSYVYNRERTIITKIATITPPAPATSLLNRKVNGGAAYRAMGLGLRAPFCLILLLLVSLGAAQARSTVLLDIEKEARDYGQISKEELASSKIPVHVERGNPLCSACQNFTTDALNYLSQKESQDKMMEVLHDACSQTFSLEKKCAELVDYYANLLFAKIAEIKPDEFCQQYGLCNSLVSGVRGESTCTFCHRFVDEIETKLKDPDAELEILELLLKECNKLQGHEQQCKRLVLQYLPLILVNGEKFLEKNDICTIVQACDAGKNTLVGSFSEGALLSDA